MAEKEWPVAIGLSVAGAIDSLYLLLYQTGKIEGLVCPVFGEGCEKVVGSPVAYPGGIPDAVFGLAGYVTAGATAAAVALTSGETREKLARLAVGGSVMAVLLSAYLTYSQPRKTGNWCFWCLLSAGISTSLAAVAVSGSRKVLKTT